MAYINTKCDELGIDRERMGRIVRAAIADVNYHEAIMMMERYGLTEEQAGEVLSRILISRWAKRVTMDRPYKESRERKELFWSITGLIGITLAVGLVIYFWS